MNKVGETKTKIIGGGSIAVILTKIYGVEKNQNYDVYRNSEGDLVLKLKK